VVEGEVRVVQELGDPVHAQLAVVHQHLQRAREEEIGPRSRTSDGLE
jgi:hypothetical protein